ncbi:MAG: hypothetical protein ACE5HC_00225 [Candidatus Binatia bacterium]
MEGFLIAGSGSGVGMPTVVTGLMAALPISRVNNPKTVSKLLFPERRRPHSGLFAFL